jgi:branched-chain amino acid transport system substrate-binding protein
MADRRRLTLALVAGVAIAALPAPARAADPIKIGFSMPLTGGLSGGGKSVILAFELWKEEVNAKGGLIGRPVELVYYDDQSMPAQVPGIYAKLLDIDKVDLVVSAYATNQIAPAMPVVMQKNMTFMALFGTGVNDIFKYDKYFQILPNGRDTRLAPSLGFLETAMTMEPKPQTIALVGADAEYAQTVLAGARDVVQRLHATKFSTIVGEVKFADNGEWETSRALFVQYQNIVGNDIDQFRQAGKTVILFPPAYRSGKFMYPYSEIKR